MPTVWRCNLLCPYSSVIFLPTGVQWPSAWSHGIPPAAGENHGHPSVSTPALPKAAGWLLFCLPWSRSQPIWAQFGVSYHHCTVWVSCHLSTVWGCHRSTVWGELPSQYCLGKPCSMLAQLFGAITILFEASGSALLVGESVLKIVLMSDINLVFVVADICCFGWGLSHVLVESHHISVGDESYHTTVWGECYAIFSEWLSSPYWLGLVLSHPCLRWLLLLYSLGWDTAVRNKCYNTVVWGECYQTVVRGECHHTAVSVLVKGVTALMLGVGDTTLPLEVRT